MEAFSFTKYQQVDVGQQLELSLVITLQLIYNIRNTGFENYRKGNYHVQDQERVRRSSRIKGR